jgi:ABC-type glycerol-3-phosphate transport system permease component
MSAPRFLRQPLALRLISAGFLVFGCIVATFPLFWITVMSFKSPVDAFAANPLHVILGPETRVGGDGLSIMDVIAGVAVSILAVRLATGALPRAVARLSHALQVRGYHLLVFMAEPGDEALDEALAAWSSSRLTTVRQPAGAMVEVTVDTLLSRIEDGDGAPRRIVLPGELIVRESARLPEGWTT